MAEIPIHALDSGEAKARLNELSEVLVDAVTHGASVNFMAGFTSAEGQAFWRSQLPEMATGQKQLLVAEANGQLVGTLILAFAHQPNAPHRAELTNRLVHSSARRQGLGRRLLIAAEEAALNAGRTFYS